MYVGFAGVSGVGKSTIATQAVAELEAKGLRCAYYSPFFQPGRNFLYKVWWGVYLWRFFNWRLYKFFVWESASTWFWKRPLQHWLWPCYQSLILSYYLTQVRSDKVDVLVYDEDIVKWKSQAVVAGDLDNAIVHDVYQRTIMNATAQALIVSVDAPSAVATERFIERDEPDASAERKVELKQKSIAHTDAILQVGEGIAQATDAEHVVLDGLQSPEINAEVVVETIEQLRPEQTAK